MYYTVLFFKGFNILGLCARRSESEHGLCAGHVKKLRESSQVRQKDILVGLNNNKFNPRRLRKGENAYTTAIRTVAEILQDYDYDKQVLGLTFGANRYKKTSKQTNANMNKKSKS